MRVSTFEQHNNTVTIDRKCVNKRFNVGMFINRLFLLLNTTTNDDNDDDDNNNTRGTQMN